MKGIKSKLHIIILTKNKIEVLFQCLDSIYEKTAFLNYYVWIADTGTNMDLKGNIRLKLKELNRKLSTTTQELNKQIKTFNLLEYNYYHFSKINNEVVRYLEKNKLISNNDLLLICNNDVRLINDCISGCIERYRDFKNKKIKVGTLGIRLHFPDNSIQHCGLEVIIKNNQIRISHKNYRYTKDFIIDTQECLGVTGAFLMTPYEVFCCCGRLNESYAEGCQDIEYNLECVRNGFQNFIVGELAAYHHESLTRNENKDKRLNENKDFTTYLFPYLIKYFHKLRHLFLYIEQ